MRSVAKTSSNKSYYTNNVYASIPLSEDDIYIIADRSTRLDMLANEYYNNSQYWKVIARANSIGKGTLYIEAGTSLRIPAKSTADQFILSHGVIVSSN